MELVSDKSQEDGAMKSR